MSISEQVLAGSLPPCVPDGLVLETPEVQGDTPLCHVDFAVAQKWLVCDETWTQTIGGTKFGGAIWRLRTDGGEYHVMTRSRVCPDTD